VPQANISHGPQVTVSVEILPDRTVHDLCLRQGDQIKDLGERRAYFAHQLEGRHCLWLERETYLFEKAGRVYAVCVRTAPSFGVEPRKIIDDILDSLRL
jgi:hypothetical protein